MIQINDIDKILLTSVLTIVGGVFVYTIGQLLSKFYIDPVAELKKCIGEAQFTFIFYAQYYMNPQLYTKDARPELKEKYEETYKELRKTAGQLMSKANSVNAYWIFAILRIVPCKNSVNKAAANFIGLSNSSNYENAGENIKSKQEIASLLNFKE